MKYGLHNGLSERVPFINTQHRREKKLKQGKKGPAADRKQKQRNSGLPGPEKGRPEVWGLKGRGRRLLILIGKDMEGYKEGS